MKVIQKFFIFSFLTVIFVVGIFFMLNINIQIPLYKVANKYSKPDVKWKKILYGKYQTEYENWFSENVSFRSFGLKGMNQILYAFDSLSDIDRGKSNVLFYKDWTKRFFINEEFDNFIGKKGNLDKYIENIEYINKYFNSHNKKLIYLITPNKAEVYEEKLPLRYKIIDKLISENEKTKIRREISNKLKEKKILNIDFTPQIEHLKDKGVKVFPKTGVHWNGISASEAIRETVDKLNAEGTQIPKIEGTRIVKLKTPFRQEELDGKNLMNVYFSKFDSKYFDVKLITEKKEKKINVFSISTSFSQALVDTLNYDMPFKKYKRYFYNTYFSVLEYKNGKNTLSDMNMGNMKNSDYEDIVKNYDILIIEHTSIQLPESHIEFVNNFSNYLRNLENKKVFTENKNIHKGGN